MIIKRIMMMSLYNKLIFSFLLSISLHLHHLVAQSRGPILEYYTPIMIESAYWPINQSTNQPDTSKDRLFIWTHAESDLALQNDLNPMFELVLGSPAGLPSIDTQGNKTIAPAMKVGAHILIIRNKDNPSKTGTVKYGDRIQIQSLYAYAATDFTFDQNKKLTGWSNKEGRLQFNGGYWWIRRSSWRPEWGANTVGINLNYGNSNAGDPAQGSNDARNNKDREGFIIGSWHDQYSAGTDVYQNDYIELQGITCPNPTLRYFMITNNHRMENIMQGYDMGDIVTYYKAGSIATDLPYNQLLFRDVRTNSYYNQLSQQARDIITWVINLPTTEASIQIITKRLADVEKQALNADAIIKQATDAVQKAITAQVSGTDNVQNYIAIAQKAVQDARTSKNQVLQLIATISSPSQINDISNQADNAYAKSQNALFAATYAKTLADQLDAALVIYTKANQMITDANDAQKSLDESKQLITQAQTTAQSNLKQGVTIAQDVINKAAAALKSIADTSTKIATIITQANLAKTTNASSALDAASSLVDPVNMALQDIATQAKNLQTAAAVTDAQRIGIGTKLIVTDAKITANAAKVIATQIKQSAQDALDKGITTAQDTLALINTALAIADNAINQAMIALDGANNAQNADQATVAQSIAQQAKTLANQASTKVNDAQASTDAVSIQLLIQTKTNKIIESFKALTNQIQQATQTITDLQKRIESLVNQGIQDATNASNQAMTLLNTINNIQANQTMMQNQISTTQSLNDIDSLLERSQNLQTNFDNTSQQIKTLADIIMSLEFKQTLQQKTTDLKAALITLQQKQAEQQTALTTRKNTLDQEKKVLTQDQTNNFNSITKTLSDIAQNITNAASSITTMATQDDIQKNSDALQIISKQVEDITTAIAQFNASIKTKQTGKVQTAQMTPVEKKAERKKKKYLSMPSKKTAAKAAAKAWKKYYQ